MGTFDGSETGVAQKEGPPRGAGRWEEETKAIERVIDVALTIDEPSTAGTIADEAIVSEQTAREHLDLLARLSIVTATTARGVTKYQPDTAYIRFKEVSAIVEKYSQDELLDVTETLQTTIESIQERFDVTSPDELRALAAEEGTGAEQVTEIRTAASEWDSVRYKLDLFKDALERYDEFDRAPVTA